ncbi:MAG: SurA N-terminal domain-containing protein [Candidatus Saccharimonadales bacterium]
MKKILRSKKAKKAEQPLGRITNETVAEHRERILAGGRRFKYPVQYARHRLVFNTVIISTVALVLVLVFVWWQLYIQQNSSSFFYRITRVVPVPVASVDSQSVTYSHYLMRYRLQAHYLEKKEGVNLQAPDSKSQVDYMKRKALNEAIADSYAKKLAKEKNITVTTKQVEDALELQRKSSNGTASKDVYDASVLDLYNLTSSEVREMTERSLLRKEVAYAIDTTAVRQRDEVVAQLKTESDFDKIVASIDKIGSAKVQAGVVPLVPSSNRDYGLAAAAAQLEVGKVSDVFRSTNGDGYYVVKLLQKDNDNRVSYAYIKIPLTIFDNTLKQLNKDGRIDEYISIPEDNAQPLAQ